jgi:hypothetical protein
MLGRTYSISSGIEVALLLLYPFKKTYCAVSEDDISYGRNVESALLKSLQTLIVLLEQHCD